MQNIPRAPLFLFFGLVLLAAVLFVMTLPSASLNPSLPQPTSVYVWAVPATMVMGLMSVLKFLVMRRSLNDGEQQYDSAGLGRGRKAPSVASVAVCDEGSHRSHRTFGFGHVLAALAGRFRIVTRSVSGHFWHLPAA